MWIETNYLDKFFDILRFFIGFFCLRHGVVLVSIRLHADIKSTGVVFSSEILLFPASIRFFSRISLRRQRTNKQTWKRPARDKKVKKNRSFLRKKKNFRSCNKKQGKEREETGFRLSEIRSHPSWEAVFVQVREETFSVSSLLEQPVACSFKPSNRRGIRYCGSRSKVC